VSLTVLAVSSHQPPNPGRASDPPCCFAQECGPIARGEYGFRSNSHVIGVTCEQSDQVISGVCTATHRDIIRLGFEQRRERSGPEVRHDRATTGPLRLFGGRPPPQLVDKARDCELGGGVGVGVGSDQDCLFIVRNLEPGQAEQRAVPTLAST
jgi:hypothetical protein